MIEESRDAPLASAVDKDFTVYANDVILKSMWQSAGRDGGRETGGREINHGLL